MRWFVLRRSASVAKFRPGKLTPGTVRHVQLALGLLQAISKRPWAVILVVLCTGLTATAMTRPITRLGKRTL